MILVPVKVEELKRELKETRALAEELHNALSAEQAEKFNLQVGHRKLRTPKRRLGLRWCLCPNLFVL